MPLDESHLNDHLLPSIDVNYVSRARRVSNLLLYQVADNSTYYRSRKSQIATQCRSRGTS